MKVDTTKDMQILTVRFSEADLKALRRKHQPALESAGLPRKSMWITFIRVSHGWHLDRWGPPRATAGISGGALSRARAAAEDYLRKQGFYG